MINRFIKLIDNKIIDKDEIAKIYPELLVTIDTISAKLSHINNIVLLKLIVIEILKPIINSIDSLNILNEDEIKSLENYTDKNNIIIESDISNKYRYKIKDNKLYLNEAYLTDIYNNQILIILEISSLIINTIPKEKIDKIKYIETNKLLKQELTNKKEIIKRKKEEKTKKLKLT